MTEDNIIPVGRGHFQREMANDRTGKFINCQEIVYEYEKFYVENGRRL